MGTRAAPHRKRLNALHPQAVGNRLTGKPRRQRELSDWLREQLGAADWLSSGFGFEILTLGDWFAYLSVLGLRTVPV